MAHFDTEVLAEFRAGLITGRRGARITAHLAGCHRCTALDDQLAGVSALLAAVSLPAVPDSVARRLDTVLAAEAARPEQVKTDQAERGDADHPADPATGRTRRPRPSLRLSLRVLAPAAAVVVAAGGYGLSQLAGSGQVTGSSGSSAERAAGQAAAPSAASRHANGVKSPVVRGAAGTAPRANRLTPGNFPLVVGTVDFSADRAILTQQVERELRTPVPTGTAATAAPVTSQLRGCVQHLTHGVGLERVESGSFRGKPAFLIVARTGPDEVAWIAGPDCSATSPDVLATTTVPPGTSEP
jgi:hypothetical protein